LGVFDVFAIGPFDPTFVDGWKTLRFFGGLALRDNQTPNEEFLALTQAVSDVRNRECNARRRNLLIPKIDTPRVSRKVCSIGWDPPL
jgi:hypothetical protein